MPNRKRTGHFQSTASHYTWHQYRQLLQPLRALRNILCLSQFLLQQLTVRDSYLGNHHQPTNVNKNWTIKQSPLPGDWYAISYDVFIKRGTSSGISACPNVSLWSVMPLMMSFSWILARSFKYFVGREPSKLSCSSVTRTLFPGSLFSASLGHWKKDPGCRWSRDSLWHKLFHRGRVNQ